jgi:hypothetical protein
MYRIQNDSSGKPIALVHLTEMAIIPFDEANTDYQQYLAWLAEGNEPEPAEE